MTTVYEDAVEHGRAVIRPVREGLMGGILGFFGITFLQWICNIHDVLWINVILAFIGLFTLIWAFTKPDLLLHIIPVEGFFAWLRDEDATQGAAGAPGKLSRVALWVMFAFSMNSLVLATWSFQQNPAAFWALELVIICLALLAAIYGATGNYTKRLSTAYLVVTAIILVLSTLPLPDYGNSGDVADSRGNATVMYNPETEEIIYDLSPADCTPEPCYAQDGIGVQLVPLPAEVANERNPKTAVAAVIGLARSPLFWAIVLLLVAVGVYGANRKGHYRGAVPAAALAIVIMASYLLYIEFGDDNDISGKATTDVVAVPESLPRCGGGDLELRTATRYKLSPDCALHLYSSESASGSWYTLDENGAEIDDSQFLRIEAFDGGFGPDGSIRHGRVLSTPATSGRVYAVLVPGGSTDDRLYLNTARDSAPVE